MQGTAMSESAEAFTMKSVTLSLSPVFSWLLFSAVRTEISLSICTSTCGRRSYMHVYTIKRCACGDFGCCGSLVCKVSRRGGGKRTYARLCRAARLWGRCCLYLFFCQATEET
eukprot:9470147-Pyramimonas_sp.AAC.2